MGGFQSWLNQLNYEKLLELVITLVAAMVCIIPHEVSHGYAAYRLGDPTAKNAGRLTMNPLRHIDPKSPFFFFILRRTLILRRTANRRRWDTASIFSP